MKMYQKGTESDKQLGWHSCIRAVKDETREPGDTHKGKGPTGSQLMKRRYSGL